jgi:hypothetical protein
MSHEANAKSQHNRELIAHHEVLAALRVYKRRPRRPPFLLVESDGVGVTSSMRPIFMPERARARRADWAPGPGVLVPLPRSIVRHCEVLLSSTCSSIHTTSSANLDVESSYAELLAADGDVLRSQHSGVWRGLVTVGLDLHATGDTADSFAATGITQVSLLHHIFMLVWRPLPLAGCCDFFR